MYITFLANHSKEYSITPLDFSPRLFQSNPATDMTARNQSKQKTTTHSDLVITSLRKEIAAVLHG